MKKLLKLMPHGQGYVEEYPDGRKELISYQTKVAEISADGWLTIYGLHSATTKRHITAFMDENIFHLSTKAEQSRACTGSYQTMKALYEGNMKMDIHTGEVVDL